MRNILAVASLLAAIVQAPATQAQCTSAPSLQADARFPALSGRLVYHSYAGYGDGSSRLFLYDFKARRLDRISKPEWQITDPMNAHFSPDGKRLAFMGVQGGRWHVFVWTIGAPGVPVNLTAGTGGNRNEDPKFSFDGRHIVFKQDGNIRILDLAFSGTANVTVTRLSSVTADGPAIENSMPYFTPSGKYVLYTRGTGAGFDIYRTNLQTMQSEAIGNTPNLADYYPIVRDQTAYFFTRWKDGTTRRDQIFMRIPNLQNDQPIELRLNDCDADNSDAAPVDEDVLVFSSTRGDTIYNLYLGDIRTGQVWSLSQFGINASRDNKLGPSYSAAR